jgi:hypothetical protein
MAAMLLFASAALGQGEAFTRLPAGPPSAMAEVVTADRARWRIESGRLWCWRGAERTEVGCSAAAGPGTVRAIALHPHGTVFVAAERGLFVCDSQHAVLDGADLCDGVPTGSLLGVHVDGRGRVWLCSAEAFGVVDARFGFGRTFGIADGLPPPPYRAVAAGADGGIVLHTADGAFGYRPDQGPPPRLPGAGGGVDRRRLAASAAGTVVVDLAATANGGAMLRMRRRHHHLLQPVVDNTLVGLRPGQHIVEVHAFDRDLRSALVAEYDVNVPLPAALARGPLIVLGAVGAASLLGVFLIAARRRGAGWRGVPRALASAALAGVVALQVLAAWLGYGRSWPFVGFTMYTENWHEGSVLHRPRILGLVGDEVSAELSPWEVGIVQDGYWQMLAEILHGGVAAQQRLWQQIAARRPEGARLLTGYLIVDARIRLTPDGPIEVAPTVMLRHEAP